MPVHPFQLVALLELAGSSDLYDEVASVLISRYCGETTREIWSALVRVSATDYYLQLMERWPRLLLSWLCRDDDLGDMGRVHLAGMRLALGHHQAAIRKRALVYLGGQRGTWKKALGADLKRLHESDPDDDVRSQAGEIL